MSALRYKNQVNILFVKRFLGLLVQLANGVVLLLQALLHLLVVLFRFGFVASIFSRFEITKIFLKVGVHANAVATANQLALLLALSRRVLVHLLDPFIEMGTGGIAIQLQ